MKWIISLLVLVLVSVSASAYWCACYPRGEGMWCDCDLPEPECGCPVSSGGGYGRLDMIEDWYDYYNDWLFNSFVTQSDLEQVQDRIDLIEANGDPLQAALIKAIRTGETQYYDGHICYPMGCTKVI